MFAPAVLPSSPLPAVVNHSLRCCYFFRYMCCPRAQRYIRAGAGLAKKGGRVARTMHNTRGSLYHTTYAQARGKAELARSWGSVAGPARAATYDGGDTRKPGDLLY